MAKVEHLPATEPLPASGDFLVITQIGRARAFEYFIDASPSLEPKIGPRVPPGGPGYASLEKAIEAAQELAFNHHVPTIYVQHASVMVRPFYPGSDPGKL